MFGHLQQTPYDLRFYCLGISVRVHPVFWLTAGILGWVPQRLDLVFVNVLCVFVSILVHEMGHALMNRRFGWKSDIVLEFFGGYATSTHHPTWRSIAVSLAGPFAGFGLLFLTYFLLYMHVRHGWLPGEIATQGLLFLCFVNLIWNVVNLLPVWPLDGGHVARELLQWLRPRDGVYLSLMLGALTGGGVAVAAVMKAMQNRGLFGLDPTFLALMFGYLAYQSLQAARQIRRGPWR